MLVEEIRAFAHRRPGVYTPGDRGQSNPPPCKLRQPTHPLLQEMSVLYGYLPMQSAAQGFGFDQESSFYSHCGINQHGLPAGIVVCVEPHQASANNKTRLLENVQRCVEMLDDAVVGDDGNTTVNAERKDALAELFLHHDTVKELLSSVRGFLFFSCVTINAQRYLFTATNGYFALTQEKPRFQNSTTFVQPLPQPQNTPTGIATHYQSISTNQHPLTVYADSQDSLNGNVTSYHTQIAQLPLDYDVGKVVRDARFKIHYSRLETEIDTLPKTTNGEESFLSVMLKSLLREAQQRLEKFPADGKSLVALLNTVELNITQLNKDNILALRNREREFTPEREIVLLSIFLITTIIGFLMMLVGFGFFEGILLPQNDALSMTVGLEGFLFFSIFLTLSICQARSKTRLHDAIDWAARAFEGELARKLAADFVNHIAGAYAAVGRAQIPSQSDIQNVINTFVEAQLEQLPAQLDGRFFDAVAEQLQQPLSAAQELLVDAETQHREPLQHTIHASLATSIVTGLKEAVKTQRDFVAKQMTEMTML